MVKLTRKRTTKTQEYQLEQILPIWGYASAHTKLFCLPYRRKIFIGITIHYFAKDKLLNLNSACYQNSTKLSMIHVTYIPEIQTSKFAKCLSPWLGRSIKIIVLCYPVLYSLPIHRL